MAGGPKLDGAGTAKIGALETASEGLGRVHALVEQMAVAVKNGRPSTLYGLQIRRAATPLVGLLKGQFGLISDQVTALIMVAGRGGSEALKVRMLREGVASLRQQLEIATTRTREKHAVEEEKGAK